MPWIVCPRRLFFLAKSGSGQRSQPRFSEQVLLKHAGYPSGTRLGIWSEVRITYRQQQKFFQYTFKTDEVNLLSFSYGESYQQPRGLLQLEGGHLFSGPISVNDSQSPSFQDMLRTPVAPPRSVLLRSLLNRPPTGSIVVP